MVGQYFVAIYQSTICWVFDREDRHVLSVRVKEKGSGQYTVFLSWCPFESTFLSRNMSWIFFSYFPTYQTCHCFPLPSPTSSLFSHLSWDWIRKINHNQPFDVLITVQTSQQSWFGLHYSCLRWQPVIRICPSIFQQRSSNIILHILHFCMLLWFVYLLFHY